MEQTPQINYRKKNPPVKRAVIANLIARIEVLEEIVLKNKAPSDVVAKAEATPKADNATLPEKKTLKEKILGKKEAANA